jgi:multiple sugar transport system substrate-binding protein
MMKHFSTRLLLLSAVVVLAGCSSSAATPAVPTAAPTTPATAATTTTAAPASPTAAPTSAGVTTISLLWGFTGGDKAAYDGMITQFNKTHPDVQVQETTEPWDAIATTTPAAFASGQGPDIVTPDYNEATVLAYASAGTILPLNDLLGTGSNQIDPSVLPKAVTDSFTINGNLYAIPADFRTLMLFYNKDLFAKAGIAAPPSTMDELLADAKQLTNAGAGQYGMAIPDNNTIAVWPILIWADGGDIVGSNGCSALDTPATIAAVQKWADAIVTDKISPVGLSGADAGNLVAAGKAAMEINGPWEVGTHTAAKINFDVAPVPKGSGPEVTLSNATPFVVNKSTKHKAAVYEFLSWWAGQDGQRQLALAAGEPPARTDMANDPAFPSNPYIGKFSAVMGDARPFLAGVPNFAKVQDAMYTAIGEVTRGADVPTTLAAASAQVNTILGCK